MYGLIVVFWVSGFDIIYSLQDSTFDRDRGLLSIPVKLGYKQSLILSALLHFLSLIFVFLSGLLTDGGILYWLGALVFAMMLIYEHAIIKPGDNSSILKAFGTINSYAGVSFCAFAIADLYIRLAI